MRRAPFTQWVEGWVHTEAGMYAVINLLSPAWNRTPILGRPTRSLAAILTVLSRFCVRLEPTVNSHTSSWNEVKVL